MKRIAAAILAVLAYCAPAYAQPAVMQAQPSLPVLADHDLTATSFTYGCYTGQFDSPLGPTRDNAHVKIKTVGSSTTVTSYTTGTNAFDLISVGDLLYVSTSGATPGGTDDGTRGRMLVLVVTARASADSITVNTAVDLSLGYYFRWRKFTTSTGATSCWIPVKGVTAGNFVVQIDQIQATSIDYQLECKADAPTAGIVIVSGPTNKTAAFAGAITFSDPWAFCRMGFKVNTDTGVQKITVTLETRK